LNFFLKLILLSIVFFYSNRIIAQNPTDCINAVIACGNSDITLNVNGIGNQELTSSNTCSSQENNSIWLSVTTVTSGTLGFTLTPNSSDIKEDYDFFVFGPNVSCGSIGQAIRCSTTNPQAAGSRSNQTGMNASERDVAEGPGSLGNNFVKWLNTNAGDTYFIVIDRPIGNSPFSLQWTGTATFSEPPTDDSIATGAPLNLEKCDDTTPFNDSSTDFNLSDNTMPITGTQSNVTITYHDSASDANIGINPLSSSYINTRNPQTIYARITNDITGCFELTDFELKVNSGPKFAVPSDLIICDNLDDGNDKNGQVFFDLTSKNGDILDGQDPADFNIMFYTSRTDAENRSGALPNFYYNTNPFNEEVFVRIETITNPNCKSITSLNLVVNETPDAFNAILIQCDEDGMNDGLTSFNINQAKNNLTGGAANRLTRFYIDPARTNNIGGDAFKNSTNPQIIYVEVINEITNCISKCELTLNISNTGSKNTFLTFCDDDGVEDGFYLFNLNNADPGVLNGLPLGLNIIYYMSLKDAVLEQNPLSISFKNTNPYSQTIYARVENANNCFGISEVLLSVVPLPNIKTEDLVYYCLNNTPDYIEINAALLNDTPNNYTYNWSNGETTYEIQINSPGEYTVEVTNSNTCTKTKTITVAPSNIASFSSTPFKIIDASENNTITVFVTGEGTYQYSLVDENNKTIKPYQDSNLFEDVFPGVYSVLVKDIKNNCGVIGETVSIVGFPKFFTPNGDGFHDTWQIYGIANMVQPRNKILIFNRFGKLIKELNPLEEGWDGTLNGTKLSSDDFWFSIKLQNGIIYKNHFTLIN